MVLLDVICLVVALAAIAFAVVAILRARGADDRSVVAASSAAQAETSARAAAAGLEQLEERLGQARQEAASAAQQAARAAQAAAQASASAAASRREAEAASDKAARAELEAAHAETAVAHLQEDRGEPDGAAEGDEIARTIGADDGADEQEQRSMPEPAVSGRATVQRAEDHDVAVGGSGATERVVQVAWRLERVRGSIWVVRNTGFAKARDALLSDATVPPKFVRPDEVIPRDVDREDVLQFRVTAGRGTPPPRIRVTWREGAGSPAYSREFTVLGGS